MALGGDSIQPIGASCAPVWHWQSALPWSVARDDSLAGHLGAGRPSPGLPPRTRGHRKGGEVSGSVSIPSPASAVFIFLSTSKLTWHRDSESQPSGCTELRWIIPADSLRQSSMEGGRGREDESGKEVKTGNTCGITYFQISTSRKTTWVSGHAQRAARSLPCPSWRLRFYFIFLVLSFCLGDWAEKPSMQPQTTQEQEPFLFPGPPQEGARKTQGNSPGTGRERQLIETERV